ncbi:peptidoglycan-binding protein LysM [Chryseobacterium sp. Marseille-Q8038]
MHVQLKATTATTTINITEDDVISIDAGSTAISVGDLILLAADYNSQSIFIKPTPLKLAQELFMQTKTGGPNFMNGTNLIPVNILTIHCTTLAGTMLEQALYVILTDHFIVLLLLKLYITLNLDYTIPAA